MREMLSDENDVTRVMPGKRDCSSVADLDLDDEGMLGSRYNRR